MAKITKKTFLETIDGTPKKRLFLSIISDYDLRTGICELVDNALDLWMLNERARGLEIQVFLDVDRQLIRVLDNAGGVRESQAELLIAPGASRNDMGEAIIGIFGVGGKRAGVALGELVEIRTRHQSEQSIQIDLTREWIESPDWALDIYAIPEVEPGTTTVDISKVRQSFDEDDVEQLRQHLAETYGWFCSEGCTIDLNEVAISPVTFDHWAFPPGYEPRQSEFTIEPAPGQSLKVTLSAGLITDRDPEEENYGVYFYCNHRLIMKEVRNRDVGYFVSAEAGVPHPDASLSRLIVEFYGPAELMPWNSSKSGINFSHPAFAQIRSRVIEFNAYYTKLSRALKNSWEEDVFQHTTGIMQVVEEAEILSGKKKILPKPPSTRSLSHYEQLCELNSRILSDRPWTLGLVEAMGMVDTIGRSKFSTRNRVALILLDSNFEIALKEYIVSNKKRFPPHKYNDAFITNLFKNRTNVIKEVQQHVNFSQKLLNKVNYYYTLRNSLIHQRATAAITDDQVSDYREVIEKVLSKLFKVKFP